MSQTGFCRHGGCNCKPFGTWGGHPGRQQWHLGNPSCRHGRPLPGCLQLYLLGLLYHACLQSCPSYQSRYTFCTTLVWVVRSNSSRGMLSTVIVYGNALCVSFEVQPCCLSPYDAASIWREQHFSCWLWLLAVKLDQSPCFCNLVCMQPLDHARHCTACQDSCRGMLRSVMEHSGFDVIVVPMSREGGGDEAGCRANVFIR